MSFLLPSPFEWIEIPAGQVEIKKYGLFDVNTFWIAKYPITVAQYEVFIEDHGYEIPLYWTGVGWTEKRKMNLTLPYYWEHERFHQPNYPVVGVSWHEAMAFCRWLGEKTGDYVHLPTEPQWQRAAQGDDGRKYPWGNEFDAYCCNFNNSRTTPVTSYENGKSPYSVMGMTGNVWEWTLGEYGDPLGKQINNNDWRTLRGGSWGTRNEADLRVNYRRFENIPIDRSKGIGFRIVCSYRAHS